MLARTLGVGSDGFCEMMVAVEALRDLGLVQKLDDGRICTRKIKKATILELTKHVRDDRFPVIETTPNAVAYAEAVASMRRR